MTDVECWIRYKSDEPELYFVQPGEFVNGPGWKRLRISRKGGYWSGMLPNGRKYRVPFTADPGGWTCSSPPANASRWEGWMPDVPAAPKGGGVTLEELFAMDDG